MIPHVFTLKEKCEEQIWTEDIGDGYSGKLRCGGTYEKIGKTNLYQCADCKKVIQKS